MIKDLVSLIPADDAQRLAALYSYEVLYTSTEEAFDNITSIMSKVFDTTYSFISLVDKDAVFYKSQAGNFGHDSVLRKDSFCSYTVLGKKPLIVTDPLSDALFKHNPYVAPQEGIRFYAGAPLITKSGHCIGTACIVDTREKSFSEADKLLLEQFAKMVMHEIEVRLVVNRQEKIEAELLASYNELQFVTENMPQLVWATDAVGYTYYINSRWLDYTSFTFDQLKGHGWTKLVHPDDLAGILPAWQKAQSVGGTYDVEYRLKGKNGQYRWFVARGIPMTDSSGKITKWYGTCTDIDDQKADQLKLQRSNERFQLVSKATQDAIWDWNLRDNTIWWNEGFKELFGYNSEDIERTAESWFSRIHPDDSERVKDGIKAIVNGDGKLWTGEYRFRKKDGTFSIVFDRGYVLHDEKGKSYRMLGSMQDISERRLQQREIKASGQRFEAAVAAVEGVIWTNNADGHMEGVQEGWTGLTGQLYQEYRGFGWADAVHPEDAQPTIDAWMEAVRERKTFIFEHRLKNKSEEWRLFSVRAIPILSETGTVTEWVGVHTDITEHRMAEEKIRQSERRFQNLVRDATVGIVVLKGDDFTVEIVNEAFARLGGKTCNQLLHKKVFDVYPELEEYFRPIIAKVMETGEPFYLFEQPYKVSSGESQMEGYVNVVYQPYREVDGKINGIMNLAQDVTQQVIARKSKEEAEERAMLAIASAELGTFEVDVVSGRLIGSERLWDIFDVDSNGTRDHLINAIHPDDLGIRTAAYEFAASSGNLEYEARVVKGDGSITWVRIKGKFTFGSKQQPTRLVGVVQDITGVKEFEEELRRKVRERTDELEQLTFVSHHDLQEPLRKISLFIDLINEECGNQLSEQARGRLLRVQDAAKRMRRALKDVLDYASLSRENSFEEVDLSVVVANIISDLELLITEKGANIQMGHLPKIKAVPYQLYQLFTNLLNNALKFSITGKQPAITIAYKLLSPLEVQQYDDTDHLKHYHQICISDNGIGFDQQMADKIFVMFQRLNHSSDYAGTGIGLAICKKVVANHNGIIWAESSAGQGSAFYFLLPAEA